MICGWLVGFFVALSSIFWGLRWPVIQHLMNLEVSSKDRATVLSIGNFANHLGLAVFALVFGHLADLFTIVPVVQLGAGLMFLVTFVVLQVDDKD